MEPEMLTRGAVLRRGGAVLGAAALAQTLPAPLVSRVWLREAAAAAAFLDEAEYLFNPSSPAFEPDPAVWTREGGLTAVAIPGHGFAAAGVGSSLSYSHATPPLQPGLGAGLLAQVRTPSVPDTSRAWLDDAISPRLTLDDGRAHTGLVWGRDSHGAREVRLANAPAAAPIPFPWGNDFANVFELHRRVDGNVAVTVANMDPAAAEPVQTSVYSAAELPASDGRVRVQFHWDREGRGETDSSCWVRVSSAWAGKSWGSMFIPRIGQEVIVDFEQDEPTIRNLEWSGKVILREGATIDPAREPVRVTLSSGSGPILDARIAAGRFVEKANRRFVFRSEREVARRLDVQWVELAPNLWQVDVRGRKFKPLFAVLLIDLDNRLNVNAHGNLRVGETTGSQTFRLTGDERRVEFRER